MKISAITAADNEVMQMNCEQLQAELAQVFARHADGIAAAYLFGSTADGSACASSDIDIAILPRNRDKMRASDMKLRLYTDISRKLGRNDIDIVILDPAGNLILNDAIIRHGKVLFVAAPEIKDAFELNLLHRCMDFRFQRRIAMGV